MLLHNRYQRNLAQALYDTLVGAEYGPVDIIKAARECSLRTYLPTEEDMLLDEDCSGHLKKLSAILQGARDSHRRLKDYTATHLDPDHLLSGSDF